MPLGSKAFAYHTGSPGSDSKEREGRGGEGKRNKREDRRREVWMREGRQENRRKDGERGGDIGEERGEASLLTTLNSSDTLTELPGTL